MTTVLDAGLFRSRHASRHLGDRVLEACLPLNRPASSTLVIKVSVCQQLPPDHQMAAHATASRRLFLQLGLLSLHGCLQG